MGSEGAACRPRLLSLAGFNPSANLPYNCTTDHIRQAMADFLEFLELINKQLHTKGTRRLECLLMPANFSSIVGEFIGAAIPKYCSALARNTYHNGHPDLVPAGMFPNDGVQHSSEGIEIKASRYEGGWQGHNPEDCWLMIFIFDCNRRADPSQGIPPKPFRFLRVLAAKLNKSDWLFAGRSETSRRTITASVVQSGYEKMMANWIYRDDAP